MTNTSGTIATRWWWVFPVLMLGIFVGDRIVNGKTGAAHFEQMRREFRNIPTPPNSEVTGKLDHFFHVEQPKGNRGGSIRPAHSTA